MRKYFVFGLLLMLILQMFGDDDGNADYTVGYCLRCLPIVFFVIGTVAAVADSAADVGDGIIDIYAQIYVSMQTFNHLFISCFVQFLSFLQLNKFG